MHRKPQFLSALLFVAAALVAAFPLAAVATEAIPDTYRRYVRAEFPRWQQFRYVGPAVGGLGAYETGAIGIGGEIGFPVRDHWSAYINGNYNFGGDTFEDPFQEDKIKVNALEVQGGLDYHVPVNGADFYSGPQVFYRNNDLTVEQSGSPDIDVEPYSEFGVGMRTGCSVPINDNARLFGHMNSQVGRGSVEENDEKITRWDTRMSYAVGLHVGF